MNATPARFRSEAPLCDSDESVLLPPSCLRVTIFLVGIMVDAKRYLADFPDEQPALNGGHAFRETLAKLQALERELSEFLREELKAGHLDDGGYHDQ